MLTHLLPADKVHLLYWALLLSAAITVQPANNMQGQSIMASIWLICTTLHQPLAPTAKPLMFGSVCVGAQGAGVSGAMIVQPANHMYDHSYVTSVLQQHPDKFVGCLLADPTTGRHPKTSVLNQISNPNLCGPHHQWAHDIL
jgi:hypothetical protein